LLELMLATISFYGLSAGIARRVQGLVQSPLEVRLGLQAAPKSALPTQVRQIGRSGCTPIDHITVLAIANRLDANQALGDMVERVAREHRVGG
jgi:hypothetical protein